MTRRIGPRAMLALAVSGSLIAGCAPIREQRGYMVDQELVAAIQPGVDNRSSVESTLGRPTFVGQFDDRDWYYVSRRTRQLAFAMPTPEEQTILHIRFDQAGNVERVERTGLELVANIEPARETTPTLGRARSFLQELFGNIGALGAPTRTGGTADDPR